MYMLFRYPVGIIIEGVVLANGRNRMRVVAPGFADAIELRRSGSNWITADRECVEVEFLMSRSGDAGTEFVMPMQNVQVMSFASSN